MPETLSPGNETLETRCPMLGHPVPFSYCTECSDLRPCRKIVECWSHLMDVMEFLGGRYSAEEIEGILAPPKPKLVQLIQLARKAAAAKG